MAYLQKVKFLQDNAAEVPGYPYFHTHTNKKCS